MGIYSDFLDTTVVLDSERPIVSLDRIARMELTHRMGQCDPDYSTAFAERVEVQTVLAFVNEVTGGNYTLTFTLNSGETFTTANIAHNSNAATVETAIDVAATAAGVAGWTNGDISVSDGPLTTGNIVLTFDGDSVKNLKHPTTAITDVDLVASTVGDVTTTVNGVVAVNEVQEIAVFDSTVTGGNFTLTFLLADATTFTTANIAYDAVAAAIETAIDTAANGVVTGWTDGDITVAGGALSANPVTLTFDGASVSGADHSLTVINNVDLVATTVNTVTTTANGVAPVNEVQTVGQFVNDVISGNYTLNFTLADATNFVTGNISYDADSAAITAAIDAAATGVVTGWTNGDISVAGGPLTGVDVVLTFDGDSVAGANHSATVIADVDLAVHTPGDVTIIADGVTPVDEVQMVAVFDGTVTGGNYTLEFTLADATNFTTANIAYNANAATIEAAIDTAANGTVAGWTDGDIAVAGGDLTAAPLTISFTGASVAGDNHSLVVIADVDLVGGTPGTVFEVVQGVAQVNEEQNIAVFDGTVTSGNYTLEFHLEDTTTFTTANIAYNADAATIEAAIDTAANGTVAGWTDGDISVANGPLTTNLVNILFDGASVEGANHSAIIVNDVDLVADTLGAVTETVAGVVQVDEEQEVGNFLNPMASGNYTLEVTLSGGTNFTTANIDFNATAVMVEGAIDLAANGVVAGWTDGDISVSGGPLQTTPLTLLFDGTSVAGANHDLTVIADIDLVPDYFGNVTATTPGVAAVDEEQAIAVFDGTVTSGNYTLQITLNGVAPFTTGNIVYSANAATIETAIDVAATAAGVPGWVNGDISVSGGPLTTASVAIVFDGTSVAGDNHSVTVIADVDLVANNVTDPVVTINGQTNRTSWAILSALGLIMSAPPVQGETPTGLTLASTPNTNANWPRPSTIQALAEQAAIDDDNIEVFNEIMSLFHIQPHTPH